MQIKIENMEDAEKLLALVATAISTGASLYTIVKNAIDGADDLNTEDKASLLAQLENMRLKDWDQL